MAKQTLFQYAIVWHPSSKDEEQKSSKLVKGPEFILAKSEKSAALNIAMGIPEEYKDEADKLEILIRPF